MLSSTRRECKPALVQAAAEDRHALPPKGKIFEEWSDSYYPSAPGLWIARRAARAGIDAAYPEGKWATTTRADEKIPIQYWKPCDTVL